MHRYNILKGCLTIALLTLFTFGFRKAGNNSAKSLEYLTPSRKYSGGPDQRVERALKKLGYKYEVNSNGNFKLTFSRKNGRSQVLFIVSETNQIYDLELRDIWSPIANLGSKPSANTSRKLLEYNSKFKMGRIIYNVVAGSYYAVFIATLSADASAEELDNVISAVVSTADDLEQELTKADKF